MANRGATTFLKRQKEQQRMARAQAKRAAKQARRENRAAAREAGVADDDMLAPEPTEENSAEDDRTAD